MSTTAIAKEFNQLSMWRKSGKKVALATVVSTWGSSPRPVGSHLVINDSGEFVGSVSGGCIESAVISEALEVIEKGTPALLDFSVSDDQVIDVGLSCGGRIDIYVERIA